MEQAPVPVLLRAQVLVPVQMVQAVARAPQVAVRAWAPRA